MTTQKFDCFTVYQMDNTSQFFHIMICNPELFYNKLFDYFFSEDRLLRYAENTSSLAFTPSKRNYVCLFKEMKKFIDLKNLELPLHRLEEELKDLLEKDGRLINNEGQTIIHSDKIGKIGEYIFCCILSDFFKFDCILPKAHLQTDYNMSIYGIDTLYYSQKNDLLLFGESKVSKSVDIGVKLINASLKEYSQQLKDEFALILSDRVLQKTLNVFGEKYGDIVNECISVEDFIEKAAIKNIGIPIFIAHGENNNPEDVFKKLTHIKQQNFFGLNTQYYLITLPILDKTKFSEKFTEFIKEKEDEYERLALL